jgi:hypothetical protein
MAWEIAVVASVLGTAFFFVYLANGVEGKTMWHQGMRLLLVLSALFVIILNAGLGFHFVQYANETALATNHTFSGMNTIMNTNIKVATVTATTFMFFFLVWLIWVVIRAFMGEGSQWKTDRKER